MSTPAEPLSRIVTELKTRKKSRRKREVALLVIALAFVMAAVIFREPILILVSVFPALASYGQR